MSFCPPLWWKQSMWWALTRSPDFWCWDPAHLEGQPSTGNRKRSGIPIGTARGEHRPICIRVLNEQQIRDLYTSTHRVCLIFPVVQIVAVIEDVFIGGVKTGFHTVLHHLTSPGGTLQLLDLNKNREKRIKYLSNLQYFSRTLFYSKCC